MGQDVEVGEIRPDDQRRGAERRPTAQATPSQSGAGEGVANRIYSSLASISSSTLPWSAPDTGHPFLAPSAALTKPA